MNLKIELQNMLNYVGSTIDDETLFIDEHSLWDWINSILAKLEEEE